MKIKQGILVCCLFLCTTNSSQQANLNQLIQEFNRIGIYNPARPGDYDAQRSKTVLDAIRKIDFPRANQYELAQRRSLDIRPINGAPLPTRTPGTPDASLPTPPTAPPTAPPTPPTADNEAELQRLRQEIARLGGELTQCRTNLERFSQIAFTIASTLSDFSATITAAAHEMDEAQSGLGAFITRQANQQRVANAERFIQIARSRMQAINGLRTALEELFTRTR